MSGKSLPSPAQRKLPREQAYDAEIFELWLSGASFRQIAGLPQVKISREGCRQAVNRTLARLHSETTAKLEHAQSVALARLDQLLMGVWLRATRGEVQAVSEARRIIELRGKIEGILATPAVEVEINQTFEVHEVEAKARSKVDELAARREQKTA